jgi:hypothetical protein
VGIYKKGDTGLSSGMAAVGDGISVAFWAGCSGGTPWEVSDWGNKTNFYVKEDGSLHAKGAEISGIITATSGNIAGWHINNSVAVPPFGTLPSLTSDQLEITGGGGTQQTWFTPKGIVTRGWVDGMPYPGYTDWSAEWIELVKTAYYNKMGLTGWV